MVTAASVNTFIRGGHNEKQNLEAELTVDIRKYVLFIGRGGSPGISMVWTGFRVQTESTARGIWDAAAGSANRESGFISIPGGIIGKQ